VKSFNEFSCCDRANESYNDFGNSAQPRRWYQHDIDQIVYSPAFRKLQKKYQLLSEKDPRCRSRMVHTLEVSRIAKEISEQLGLNIELTEAIALGHDLANTAFGNPSNRFLKRMTGGFFTHEEAGSLMLKYIGMKELRDRFENKAVAKLDKEKNKSHTWNAKIIFRINLKFLIIMINITIYAFVTKSLMAFQSIQQKMIFLPWKDK